MALDVTGWIQDFEGDVYSEKIGKFGQVTKNTLRKIEKCGQGDQKYMKKNWKNMVK